MARCQAWLLLIAILFGVGRSAGQPVERPLDPTIQTLLDEAATAREAKRYSRAYRLLGKAYRRAGTDCMPCVRAFVDLDLAAGDLEAALDSAAALFGYDDKRYLLQELAAWTDGKDEAVLRALVQILAEEADADALIENVEAYLDSHDHRVRATLCAAVVPPGPDGVFARAVNDDLHALGWRGPFLPGGDVTPPRRTHGAFPGPTASSVVAEIRGFVQLAAVISPRGKPTTVMVMEDLGAGLGRQAEQALWDWRFEPGQRGGEPVAVCLGVTVPFGVPHAWAAAGPSAAAPLPGPDGGAEPDPP